MKAFIASLCCWVFAGSVPVSGQTSSTAQPASPGSPTALTGQQNELEGDRFPALRESADRLRADYEKTDGDNMREIEKLMRTRRCQINRIGGLLDRTLEAMQQWLVTETKYWEVWGEAEQKRVDGQIKTLAGMEADQKRIADLLDLEKKDREELLRRRAALEKGKRTQEIADQIDGLVKDIQDSEARLNEAQKQYDTLTVQISNMKASISTRLVLIRQNKARLEAYGLDMSAYYEKQRAAAQEVCNTKQPDTRQTPLPKRKTNP
jgi:hypothetical protein